jgi:site-specific recombinase XerD
MIASGVNLPTVQAILDHKDVSTTMRYVHLLGDSIQQVISSFSVLPTSVSTANLKLLK